MDYINKKFNKLTILKDAGKDKYSHKLVEVQCDCEKGTIFTTRLRSVLDSVTSSCGCIRIGINKKYNTYDLTGEYGIGYTAKGKEFYFDLEDYDKIKDFSWCSNKAGYIVGVKEGRLIGLHNLVMNSIYIDHIFLNPYDNRKQNLRIITNSQNQMNRKGHGEFSYFGLKGISLNKITNVYDVKLYKDRKLVYQKYYKTITEAINARIEAEKIHFGEYRYVWENNIKWDELLEYSKLIEERRNNK